MNANEIQSVVKRLRGEQQEADREAQKVGHDAGVEWAKTTATRDQLARAATWQQPVESHEDDADSNFEDLVVHTSPEANGDPYAVRCFWEEALGNDFAETYKTTSLAVIRGFVDGATEVWDAVKSK